MRVAINVEQLLHASPGGIGRYVGQLVSLLPALHPEDQLVAVCARHRPEDAAGALLRVGVPPTGHVAPVVLPLPRPLLYRSWLWTGRPRLDRAGATQLPGARDAGAGRVDLVHAPSVAVPGRGAAPLVVTVHDAAHELFPEAFSRAGRAFHRRGVALAARRADLVLTVSNAAAEEIASLTPIPRSRIRVVPLGVQCPAGLHPEPDPEPDVDPGLDRNLDRDLDPGSDAALRRSPGRGGGGGHWPYVFWLGSAEPRKDLPTLVGAMARLARRHGAGTSALGETRLVLAGFPGWRHGGRVRPEDRQALGERLVEVGTVPDATLWALYRDAALFAFPSRHEGFGLPVLEAMSQGTAVLCSDIPALREVGGTAAAYAPVGDVTGWSERIEALLADEPERARLGAAGRARAAEFPVEAFVEGTHRAYLDVLGN